MREPQQDNLISESPAMLEILERVSSVARLDKPVLVIGERGTGKELIASRLHYLSRRWERPFIKLNCAALAESLLETELFGHEAGAFTGASKRHSGRFELANSGSLFLDELASTSARVQEKLLRVIEYGEFERVGGSQTLRTDVRLVAATNEDLPTLAQQGKFRADLLDRLAFDVITLPPLRHRSEDIIPLADHFARRMTSEMSREYFAGFSKEARKILIDYHWPGNIRELKNVVERAVYRSEEDEEVQHIQLDPFESPWRPASQTTGPATPALADEIDFKEQVEAYETGLIENALELSRFNQRKAADMLGLTYHQLRGLLRKYPQLHKEES